MIKYLELFSDSPTDDEDNQFANREIPALDSLRSPAAAPITLMGIGGYCAMAEDGWIHLRLDGQTVASFCSEMLALRRQALLPLDLLIPPGSELVAMYHPKMGGSPDNYSLLLKYEEA